MSLLGRGDVNVQEGWWRVMSSGTSAAWASYSEPGTQRSTGLWPSWRAQRARDCGPALIAFMLLGVGCGRSDMDIPRDLRIAEISTGWLDAGAHDLAQNKLVPTISFRLDNISEHETGSLRVQGIFHRAGEEEAWGSAFIRATGREGLAPGGSAGPLTLRSERGYTGEQAIPAILDHKDFVDVTVELFIKHGSAQWVRLDQYQIERRLIADEGAV